MMKRRFEQIGEVYEFETFDGQKLPVSGKVWIIDTANFGMPTINYETRQAYKQDGETLVDYQLGSRSFVVNMYYEGAKTRTEYWENRKRLIDIFRPNRGGAITMKIVRYDNSRRSIDCYLTGGLGFDTESANNNRYDIEAAVNLVALNPTWYDSNVFNETLVGASGGELVFPMAFDDEGIVFGIDGFVFSTGALNYQGNWKTYPKITITGQYDSATIENTATGVEAILASPITATETRVIDFERGDISIVDENGDSAFDELQIGSNMNLAILPDSELTGSSEQSIDVTVTNSDANTSVTVEYKTRYIGI